ncbi:lytic transglycosylase domain-containing protein [Hydrogenophaga sp. PBL-H3]|uniref:lytic transglycosylase domain-containing protein n=1 Tax=Hydrogenophaga sp. PBL-H3 TaxID=434010 RepID=UPI0013202D10|nr:transglycosylase SLT domain-containing protein [Hydrogenophaga sp. PBL-H3]QHE77074.1 transglycosylase SLT domain-containing protein [Hydrogenophaga sp. PBL-H3]QHE81498.1 transglycosylase SLT domain-containing protein [Hydrogenophaga sp. PBL-H3]
MIRRHLLRLLLALALAAAGQAHAVDAAQRQAWRDQAQAFEHGEGVKRDTEAAIGLYCQAALAGDATSAYNLGWIYANGRGVARNDGYAAHWFARAALLGDTKAEAMFNRLATQADKPECVQLAERSDLQKANEARQAAEVTELATRYQTLVDTPEEQRIMKIVHKLAPQFGIQPGLAFAVIRAESNFNVNALSDKNAQGLMQLIPETAARFRVRKPFDAEQNIRGGLSYLQWLLAYFRGDVPLVLAAYNAGEGTVDRYRGVPPYPETQGYIKRIQQVFALQHHPFDARITSPSPALPLRLP